VTVRRATADELAALAPSNDRPTIKAWVGVVGGQIVGIGGLAFRNGRWIAFCDLTDKARRHKRAIVAAGSAVMHEARWAGHRFVYAQPDPNEPIAGRWLESLGFQLDKKTGLYRWQA